MKRLASVLAVRAFDADVRAFAQALRHDAQA
jgi:hypothetical protein